MVPVDPRVQRLVELTRLAVVVVVTACGRLSFAPFDDTSDATVVDDANLPLVPCLTDAFDTGVGTWQGDWLLRAGLGPDGTDAFGRATWFTSPGAFAWHAQLQAIRSIDLELDFHTAHPNADFHAMLLSPGWTTTQWDGYDAGVFPVAGDSAPDYIIRSIGGTSVTVATNTPSFPYNTWHRFRLRSTPTTMTVDLDGVTILSTSDGMLAPPFDLVFRLYFGAMIDNVTVACAR